MVQSASRPETNLLLAALPPPEQRRLARRFETVALRANEDLYEAGRPIKHLHFPTKGCLISLVKVLDDGKSLDAGPVGYEGVVGMEAILGVETQFGATVRIGGGALRLSANALKAELRGNGMLSDVLLCYFQFLLVNVSTVAGCNRFHSLEKHFCSWLLTLQDRVGSDELEITHEVFAKMLGVRRVGITQAARKLQQAGLIRYSWGKLTILDRRRLETHACVCYRQHTRAYQRLLDPAWPYNS
jgi:CRP-like cAMP-binding protein